MLDTNLKNNDDLEMKNAGNENVTNGNVVKKNHNWKILGIIAMILTVLLRQVLRWGYIPIWKRKLQNSTAGTAGRKQKQQAGSEI